MRDAKRVRGSNFRDATIWRGDGIDDTHICIEDNKTGEYQEIVLSETQLGSMLEELNMYLRQYYE